LDITQFDKLHKKLFYPLNSHDRKLLHKKTLEKLNKIIVTVQHMWNFRRQVWRWQLTGI
jgi:hypothetical protein